MKKILALAVGMLLIPFTAFGMEAMDDASMDSITGQSGVAITLDNVAIYNSGATVWYQGGSTTNWIGMTSANELTLIDPWDGTTTDVLDPFTLTSLGTGDDATVHAVSPLVIQTSDDTDSAFGAAVPGVKITLGTLDIRSYYDESVMEIGMGTDTTNSTFEAGTFGRISMADERTVILGGTIYIVPAGSLGF